MNQAQHIARQGAPRHQRFHRVGYAAVGEFPQERIPRTQGKKCQGGRLAAFRLRKKTIHDLVGGAVAADRDELPVAATVGGPRQFRGLAWSPGLGDLELDPSRAQPLQRRPHQLAAASTPGRRIDHCEIGRLHSATTAARLELLLISPASAARLIFMDAVRGKSPPQSRYPPTRLKSGRRRFAWLI